MASMTPQMRAFNDVALSMFCGYYDEIIAKNSPPVNGVELMTKLQELIYSEQSIREIKPASFKENVTSQEEERNQEPVYAEPNQEPSKVCGSDLLKQFPLKYTTKVVNDDGALEEVTKNVDLPYLSCIDYSTTCQALKVNGGLLSPCLTRPAKSSSYCKTCSKAGLVYGTIADRMATSIMCYKSPKGKKEISFGTYCAKRNIPQDEMEKQIAELYNGLVLPKEQWDVDKTKASRPIKSSGSSSDGDKPEQDADAPKKKRGRPKKTVKIMEDVTATGEENTAKVVKPVVKKSKKIKKAEVEVSSDGELEAEEPVHEEPAHKEPVVEEPVVEEPADSDSGEEDDNWSKVMFEGLEFLVDEENTLWLESEDDAEVVGTWDPIAKTPTFNEGISIDTLKE